MYPQGLELHKMTHTKVGLIPCTNCPLRFTENRNMLAHATTHQGNEFTCDVCSKKFNIKPNLDQHIRGHHGDGWPTPCGETVDWLRNLSAHKRGCPKCIQIKVKEERKAAKLAKNLAK